jgi:phage gpG-like protein
MVSTAGLSLDSGLVQFDFQPSLGMLARDIDKLGVDIRSFRVPLTESVRTVMVPSIRTNFAVGGRPPWEALAESTVEIRGDEGPILVRSGALSKVASQINIWSISQVGATIKDLPQKVWYGKVHQAGYAGSDGPTGGDLLERLGETSFIGSGLTLSELAAGASGHTGSPAIPARPFIMFQPEDEVAIEAVFARWLEERVARDWARGM